MEGWGRSGVTDGAIKNNVFFLDTYVTKSLIASLGKETENKKSDATLSAKVNFSQVREKGPGNDVVITIVFGVIRHTNQDESSQVCAKLFPLLSNNKFKSIRVYFVKSRVTHIYWFCIN